jgi:hypothetical protein
MFIYEKDTEDVQTLSIYKYKVVANVKDYSYIDYDKWLININYDDNKEEATNHYMIIDTLHNDAFGHWVYESAIYLLLFIQLRQLYPKIKLHLQCHKEYKRMFYEHFGIDKMDVTLELTPNNICIFPLPISANNKNTICSDYIAQMDAFCSYIRSSVPTNLNKNISILLMPRQTKENYVGNDRSYNIEDIYSNLDKLPNTVVLNTDNIKTLREQIELVNSSKNIILHSGAAYCFNGMISNNANILVLDASHHHGHIREYIKVKYIDYIVQTRNTINNISNTHTITYDDIKEYIEE